MDAPGAETLESGRHDATERFPSAHVGSPRASVDVFTPAALTLAPTFVEPIELEEGATGVTRWAIVKRGFDLAVSCTALVLALPLLLLIALAIKLDSKGPVFYRVRRVGYRGRPLMMLKYRKMRDDASGGPLTTGGDPRLTRVGAVLTRTRLDELPQLWDVLRGRMSVIGPRPEDPGFVALYPDHYAHILLVRPGISGLSQLAYAGESQILNEEDPVEDYIGRILPQKLGMDRLYARRASLRLDLAIIFWTVMTVLLRRPVAVNRTTARMNIRRRLPAKQVEPTAPAASASSSDPSGESSDRISGPSPTPSPARRSVA